MPLPALAREPEECCMLPNGVRGKAPVAKSFGAFWVLQVISPVDMLCKTACVLEMEKVVRERPTFSSLFALPPLLHCAIQTPQLEEGNPPLFRSSPLRFPSPFPSSPPLLTRSLPLQVGPFLTYS